jgi:tripartite-type tricarboxylate transporter receptor subunit TctC
LFGGRSRCPLPPLILADSIRSPHLLRSIAVNATLYKKLNFVFLRDIAPVASMIRQPLIMLVNPSVPAKTIPEFVDYAKANPGKISMASGGNGTHKYSSMPAPARKRNPGPGSVAGVLIGRI